MEDGYADTRQGNMKKTVDFGTGTVRRSSPSLSRNSLYLFCGKRRTVARPTPIEKEGKFFSIQSGSDDMHQMKEKESW